MEAIVNKILELYSINSLLINNEKSPSKSNLLGNYNKFLDKLPDVDNIYLNRDHKNVVMREMYFTYTELSDIYNKKGEAEKYEHYINLAKGIKDQ